MKDSAQLISRPACYNPFQGPMALLSAARFLAQSPGRRRAAAVPIGIAFGLSAVLVWASFRFVGPGFAELTLGSFDGPVISILHALAQWLGAFFAAYVSLHVAMAISPPLSAPALEHLVTLMEHELRIPPRQPLGMWKEFLCGLSAQVNGLLLTLPLALLLWLVGVAVPALAPIVVPLSGGLLAFSVAWNLLDYPLSLRGVPVRQRLELMRKHPMSVFSFGASFALVFWIPGCGVLLLPLGAVAGTQLLWSRIARVDPKRLNI